MIIENYELKGDVKPVCFDAESFPDGVQEPFKRTECLPYITLSSATDHHLLIPPNRCFENVP